MKTKSSGIVTAEQIRRRAEAEAWEPPELVTLPSSGFVVKMRRPRPLAYVLAKHPLPQLIALKVQAYQKAAETPGISLEQQEELLLEQARIFYAAMTPENRLALLLSQSEILCAAILEPKFALEPKEGELDPRLLAIEDQKFILDWIRGEVESDGSDLGGFRDAPGPTADRPSSGEVRVPPQRAAARKDR